MFRSHRILRHAALVWLACAAAWLGLGCDNDAKAPPSPCNPLGLNHCLTPWPSAYFEVADATTVTGKRVALTAAVLPSNVAGEATDPTPWNAADGFSAAAPMVMSFPAGVSVDNLVGHHDMDASVDDASPTLLLDLTTGQRVLHFAEVDVQAPTVAERALLIRPARRLTPGHHYVVALRRTLRDAAGEELARPAAFAAMLAGDGGTLTPGYAAQLRTAIDAIVADGTAEDDLLLVWDFTTASDDFVRGDALSARDQAVAALAATPQTFEISETFTAEAPIEFIADGWFDAPLFLTNDGDFDVETVLARAADGTPAYGGMYRVPFTVVVPMCAKTAKAPVGMLVFGHGLMGLASEARTGTLRDTAAALCMVMIATDFRGMSTRDISSVALTLNNIGRGSAVFEVLTQGIVNNIALSHIARTVWPEALFAYDHDDNSKTPDVSYVDPTKVYYYGLSQGHIFGTTIVAYDPFITRAVLGVGGGNYSTLLERSTDWPGYRDIMVGAYPNALDRTLIINLLQQRWDRTETAGVASDAIAGTSFGNEPKQFLLQMALGDDQVPNLGTEWQARTMDMPVLLPSMKQPWGLTTLNDGDGAGASALAIYDIGSPPPPYTNVPAPDTGAHYATRGQPAAWRQMVEFFATGVVANHCDGPCLCAIDRCE
ncbi:MAG: hypothetical protein IPL79_00430 [Myxococcales bacterium]|nr:hypothetical protein [Myxococcales bacterium]